MLQLYFNQVIGLPAMWVGTALMISIAVERLLMRIPRERGHDFPAMVGTDSTASWAPQLMG